MHEFEAPAWQADWLMAWLASLGVLYRDRSIKLSWSGDGLPHAVFHIESPDQLDAVLPPIEELESLAIARQVDGYLDLSRNPAREALIDRAMLARRTGDLSLGGTISDIGVPAGDDLPHSPFDAPAPRGITLGERVVASRSACGDAETLRDSMVGASTRSAGNGLGLDLRRLAPSAVPGGLVTEPFVETMAFFGIVMFSQVGDRTRGWSVGSTRKTGAFQWPAWRDPLDWAAVDAALDEYWGRRHSRSAVIAEFDSIAYRPTSTSETNRGLDGVARRR